MLGLDKRAAETLKDAVDWFALPSFIDKKKVLKFGLDLGLTLAESATSLLKREKTVNQFLTSHPKNSIRLLFPNLDFSYSYPTSIHDQKLHSEFLKMNFDLDQYIPYHGIGSLIPHIPIENSKYSSIRELISRTCYEQNRSLKFMIPLST